MEDEWEATKRELVCYFSQNEVLWRGGGKGDGASGWGQQAALPNEARRLNAAFAGGSDMSEGVKRKMLEYARRVLELNERRKQEKPYPLAYSFSRAAVTVGAGDASQKGLKNCWDLVQNLMAEDVSQSGESKVDPPSEGEYEKERRLQGGPSARVLKHWLNGARSFLEEQYFAFIENFVKTHQRKDIYIGSMPGTDTLLQAFTQAMLKSNAASATTAAGGAGGASLWDRCEKPDGVNPIWAQIYYSMRSGQLETAERFARLLGDKSQFFKWYVQYRIDPNHILPSDLSVQVMAEYRRLSSHDPFMHLVYNLVGQCDPMRSHDGIHPFATEDYMWIKLNMVTVDEISANGGISASAAAQLAQLAHASSSATSPSFGMPAASSIPNFTLSHFQNLITEYGPEHFSNPILYFQILMLSLQFETAIQFLESTGQFPVETLHFALTLYYYGALNLPDNPLTAPLHGHQQRQPFWNIIRHLTQYIRNLDNSNVLASLNYLYVIRTPDVRNLCIRDLLTDTQEFSLLLGSVNSDGTRQPGYLEKFVSQEDWREIVSLAAVAYEQAGKYDDSIALFDAASYYDKVVDLITKQLSRILTGSGPERQRLIDYAAARFERYDSEMGRAGFQSDLRGEKVWSNALSSFRMLLQLCVFFDLYHASKYHEALDIIADIGLVPFDHSQIESCSGTFKNISDPVRRNFAEIVLATMTCLYRMFIIIKEEGLNAEREAFLRALKVKAKTIVTFTGMINFRIPADTQSRLVRMEASMT